MIRLKIQSSSLYTGNAKTHRNILCRVSHDSMKFVLNYGTSCMTIEIKMEKMLKEEKNGLFLFEEFLLKFPIEIG